MKKLLWFFLHRKSRGFSCAPKLKAVNYDHILKNEVLISDINKTEKNKINRKLKMLGICPNCKIKLKIPPFRDRETNEVLIVMIYRNKIDNKIPIRPIKEIGYCEICKADEKDIQEQLRIESKNINVIN